MSSSESSQWTFIFLVFYWLELLDCKLEDKKVNRNWWLINDHWFQSIELIRSNNREKKINPNSPSDFPELWLTILDVDASTFVT